MTDEQGRPEVEWMPGVAVGVLTLVITQFVWVVGTAIAVAGLLGFAVLALRREWRPCTWVCLGAAIGGAVFWAVVGLPALG